MNEEKAAIERKVQTLIELMFPDKPGFKIQTIETRDKLILNLFPRVKSDTAYFIGKNGKMASSLRVLVSSIGAQHRINAELYIIG